MIYNLFFMDGYGVFVWSSFIISFLICGIFYYKTLRTLKKYEKELACKILELSEVERTAELKKSKILNQVFLNYNK